MRGADKTSYSSSTATTRPVAKIFPGLTTHTINLSIDSYERWKTISSSTVCVHHWDESGACFFLVLAFILAQLLRWTLLFQHFTSQYPGQRRVRETQGSVRQKTRWTCGVRRRLPRKMRVQANKQRGKEGVTSPKLHMYDTSVVVYRFPAQYSPSSPKLHKLHKFFVYILFVK